MVKNKRVQAQILPYLAFTIATIYFCFSLFTAHELPPVEEGKPITVTGWVASLPSADKWQSAFNFRLNNQHRLIRLNWSGAHKLHVGEKWQLLVKLKRIHGTHNPGGFDYEAYAKQQGLSATGSVIKNPDNKLIADNWYRYPVSRLRQYLHTELKKILPHSATAPWLLALTVGARDDVNTEDWDVLKNTGTNHLMAIAGLHIGMVSGFMYLLAELIWRRYYRGMLWLPAQVIAASVALITAIIYAMLSGFEIPAQRACFMLSVFISAVIWRRQISAWFAWMLALTGVVMLNPASVFSESFWLSFGTLAIIIYAMSGRLAPSGIWWKHFRIQWVIGFGLTPLALLFFQQTSLISFFANTIAIPWLGILILPFCLLATLSVPISSTCASLLLLLADNSLSLLWIILSWFATFPNGVWVHPIPNAVCMAATLIAVALLLLPAGMPGRLLGILWLLPLLCLQPDTLKHNEYTLSLLDVGQGLSVVIQTARHTLIFDAGPKLNARTDAGKNIVIPYLRSQGISHIDRLVISHPDNDHIGGAGALLKEFNISSIMTSTPEKFAHASYCLAGYEWEWDGVTFEFLYPSLSDLHLNNDSSCVLLIDNGRHRALLTGDIEKMAEYKLLNTVKDRLAADILVAPHHGSKTSGVPAFIQAVHPQYVLYATGYRNRYHFPHKSVMERYAAINAIQLNTAEVGMVRFRVGETLSSHATINQSPSATPNYQSAFQMTPMHLATLTNLDNPSDLIGHRLKWQ